MKKGFMGTFGLSNLCLVFGVWCKKYHENTKYRKHEIFKDLFRDFVLSCFRDKISFLFYINRD